MRLYPDKSACALIVINCTLLPEVGNHNKTQIIFGKNHFLLVLCTYSKIICSNFGIKNIGPVPMYLQVTPSPLFLLFSRIPVTSHLIFPPANRAAEQFLECSFGIWSTVLSSLITFTACLSKRLSGSKSVLGSYKLLSNNRCPNIFINVMPSDVTGQNNG